MVMSPELETLDQLISGELPLLVIRRLFADDEWFVQGILAMLESGQVRLLAQDSSDVPAWRRRDALAATLSGDGGAEYGLALTSQGAKRIA
jgi:hypothetical protein